MSYKEVKMSLNINLDKSKNKLLQYLIRMLVAVVSDEGMVAIAALIGAWVMERLAGRRHVARKAC